MEQKAKKRLNVIDIIAVVVILAAVLFVGYKMMDRGGEAVQPEMVKVTYKVKKEGVPAEMYENSKKHLPSKLMASGAFVGGEIIDVDAYTGGFNLQIAWCTGKAAGEGAAEYILR